MCLGAGIERERVRLHFTEGARELDRSGRRRQQPRRLLQQVTHCRGTPRALLDRYQARLSPRRSYRSIPSDLL